MKNNRVVKKYVQKVVESIVKEQGSETKPAPTTKPTTAPSKPGTDKPKPRRPLGNPEVKPKPKAMNEEEMLQKIVQRFKNKGNTNEGIDDISSKIVPYTKFQSADELIKSISSRIIAATQLKDWYLVDEIAADILNYVNKNK